MPLIALATYAAAPALTADDELLARALSDRGAAPRAVPWSDTEADWSGFDLVVIRSTWDYHLRAAEFERWIADLDRAGIPLVNAPEILRWNGNKRYLLDLAECGVAIVPTEFVATSPAGPATRSLREILDRHDWQAAVVKPAVSASGDSTWRTSAADAAADEPRFRALCATAAGGVLVQPFVPEIVEDGEWSLVFIGGRYSHAAIKRARDGEFRVQSVHGGTYAPAVAPAGLVADAERVVESAAACVGVAATDIAYARVDGVAIATDGGARLLLMELECLEPNLFFGHAPEAAARLADVLLARALASVTRRSYLGLDRTARFPSRYSDR